jgi:hypothetical protein
VLEAIVAWLVGMLVAEEVMIGVIVMTLELASFQVNGPTCEVTSTPLL